MSDGLGAGPQSLEDELRRRLNGYRMVFEIGLDEPTVTRARDAVAALARGRSSIESMLAKSFPSILVTYLAGEANAVYQGGGMWNHLSIPELRGRGTTLGPAFARAVGALGLEEFGQLLAEGALRYVSPILAHGGIPRSSARDFWTLLTDELERTPGAEAQEIVTVWRQRGDAFRGKDVPVRRFLLYGGQPAMDFLDRCVDLAEGSEGQRQQFGLPAHIVETFANLSEAREIRVGRRGPVLPRPRVLLDPWDGVGPVLELPSVARAFADARWRVGGETVREYPASTTEARSLALAPATAWEVEFIDRSLAVPRTYRFDALATPALCFDPSSKSNVRTVRPLFVEDVWLIAPDQSQLQAEDRRGEPVTARVIEELPALAGAWRGYSVAHLDLRDLRSVSVTHLGLDGELRTAKLQIVPASARAKLVGAASPGVATVQGFEVLADRPRLFIPDFPGVPPSRWRIEVRTDVARQCTAEDLGGVGAAMDMGPLLPADYLGIVEVSVRGPLGSDLRGAFAMAPGLRVTQPAHILLPGERAEVAIAANSNIAIAGRPVGASLVHNLAPDESQLTLILQRAELSLTLQVRVAKLQWALHRPSGQSGFAAEVLALDVDELRTAEVDALLISTYRPDVDMWLVVEKADGQHLQASGRARTSRVGGRWRFPLDTFIDTIAESGESSLALTLRIEGHSVPLARVVARLDIQGIRATSEPVGPLTRVVLRFTESRPLRGRVAYLWSLERPWDAPIDAPIPDGVTGVATFEAGAVTPGAYRAHIAILDAWNAPQRPRRDQRGVADLVIVGAEPSSDTNHPRSLLATVMRDAERPPALTDSAAVALATELIACIVAALDDSPAAKKPRRLLRVLAELLFVDVSTASASLADAVAAERISTSEALRFSISALPYVRPGEVPAASLRALWRTCAPLACAIDLLSARDDSSATERLEEFAGWSPGRPLPPPGHGLKMDGSWVKEGVDEIRAHQRDWNIPTKAASLAAYVLATYEWLATAKEDEGTIDAWWQKFDLLMAPKDAPAIGSAHLKVRRSSFGPVWAQFPASVLTAAFHTVLQDAHADSSSHALAAASAFAPRLVSHDLCFALIAAASAQRAPVPEAVPQTAEAPVAPVSPPEPREDPRVLEALRSWSASLTKRSSYLRFTDEELRALARHKPPTISGLTPLVSEAKAERYATEILGVIADATR